MTCPGDYPASDAAGNSSVSTQELNACVAFKWSDFPAFGTFMRTLVFALVLLATSAHCDEPDVATIAAAERVSRYEAAFSEAMHACSSSAVWMRNQYDSAWPAAPSYVPNQTVIKASLPFASVEGVRYLQQKTASYPKRVRGHVDHSCTYQLLAYASAMTLPANQSFNAP